MNRNMKIAFLFAVCAVSVVSFVEKQKLLRAYLKRCGRKRRHLLPSCVFLPMPYPALVL